MSGKVKAPVPDYPILSSSLDYCSVCDAPIKFEDRPEDKDPLTVYGLNGSYHVSMIILSLLGCQNCFFLYLIGDSQTEAMPSARLQNSVLLWLQGSQRPLKGV